MADAPLRQFEDLVLYQVPNPYDAARNDHRLWTETYDKIGDTDPDVRRSIFQNSLRTLIALFGAGDKFVDIVHALPSVNVRKVLINNGFFRRMGFPAIAAPA